MSSAGTFDTPGSICLGGGCRSHGSRDSFFLFVLNIYLFIWLYQVLIVTHGIFSCGRWDLVPWPGIEPRLAASGTQSLSHWTPREVPGTLSYTHNPRARLRAWLNRPINTPSSQSSPMERSNPSIRFEAKHSCLSKSLILLKLCFSHLCHVAIIYLICDHDKMLSSSSSTTSKWLLLELLFNRYTVSLSPNYWQILPHLVASLGWEGTQGLLLHRLDTGEPVT